MCTDAPAQSGSVNKQSGLADLFGNSDLTDSILAALFDNIFNNRGPYAVDLPTDGPQKIKSLKAALGKLFDVCDTDKALVSVCEAHLVRRLQMAVREVQDQLKTTLLTQAKSTFPQQDGKPRQDCQLRENIGFDEWDVWDLVARRNGVDELRHLRQLVNGNAQLEEDTKGLIRHVLPYAKDGTTHYLVLTNKVILQLLPHVWGMSMWLQRHMIVYPKVQQWDNDDRGARPTEERYGPYEAWDVSNVTSMKGMFNDASRFNKPIGAWDVSNVRNMQSMFRYAENFSQPIGTWDVRNVESTDRMFYAADNFNQPIEKWDVSNVTNMAGMFQYAENFNQPIQRWDVGNVKTMAEMFYAADSFNKPIKTWDVRNVTDMRFMFTSTQSFNQPLEKWDVSNVTQMGGMFSSATSFNQPLEGWDVRNVTDMSMMFKSTQSFNQPLKNWNVSNVTGMFAMFKDTKRFNHSLDRWDVRNVTDMESMFENAQSFHQPLSDWKLRDGVNTNRMFRGARFPQDPPRFESLDPKVIEETSTE
jgi:surface protein